MGFSGSFVLARIANVEDIDWIEGEPFESSVRSTSGGDWLSARYDDEDPYWAREENLAGLVTQSQSPALVALCLDSDFLAIAGRSTDSTQWDGVIGAGAAASYRAEGLQEGYDVVVPTFMRPDRGVAGAVAWSYAAGLLADETALTRMLSSMDSIQPADAFWDDLLDALGLGNG